MPFLNEKKKCYLLHKLNVPKGTEWISISPSTHMNRRSMGMTFYYTPNCLGVEFMIKGS